MTVSYLEQANKVSLLRGPSTARAKALRWGSSWHVSGAGSWNLMDEEERRGRSVWSERGAPAGKEELITDYGFSVWDDEKVLETVVAIYTTLCMS